VSLTILNKQELSNFVGNLLPGFRVFGPVRQNGGFAFQALDDPEALQLDYPTTILPPKKYFLPPKETLFEFNKSQSGFAQPPEKEQPAVIFGVHTCDLHAIQLLDHVFSSGHADSNYLNRRRQTIIIGIECLSPCDENSFCKSMGTMTADEGYDLHFIDLGDTYAVDVSTSAGQELLDKYAKAQPANTADENQLNHVLSEKWPRFPYRLDCDISDLPSLLNMSMKSPLWEELGKRCLVCAACTNVCPTCFCFDVQDEIDLTLESGRRIRTWDSCQFATAPSFHAQRKVHLRCPWFLGVCGLR